MSKEEAIEIVCNAFDIWYGEYTYIDDWSKEFEARDMAIEALEQESVLDKIRAEIMSKDGLDEALEIIDRYRAESEDKE